MLCIKSKFEIVKKISSSELNNTPLYIYQKRILISEKSYFVTDRKTQHNFDIELCQWIQEIQEIFLRGKGDFGKNYFETHSKLSKTAKSIEKVSSGPYVLP